MPQASDVVYQKLKLMVYRGALGPGARLVERTLARELGTSRVPAREGVARLETEGLEPPIDRCFNRWVWPRNTVRQVGILAH
jgi:hypothetical protein